MVVKRFIRGMLVGLAYLWPGTNGLLLLAGIALVTRGFFYLWAPLVWIFPGAWLMLWGLGVLLPPGKGGGK